MRLVRLFSGSPPDELRKDTPAGEFKRMKYVNGLLAGLACLLLGYLVYQQSLESTEVVAKAKEAPPIAVEITRVQKRTVNDRIDVVGSLDANASVELRARVSGYIKKLPYDMGDYVEAGAVVVELDDSEFTESVVRAEAALKVAQANLAAQTAKADLAQDDVNRLSGLAESGVTTPQQLDQARAQLAIAQAELELGQAQVAQAESDRLQSQLRLKDTKITTPFAGYVASRLVETGDLAQPNLPLLNIADLSIVRTIVHVVERDYHRVQAGQRAQIQVDAYPGEWFEGTVIRKAPVVDPDTRTAEVHIELLNDKARLKPGMHARVRLMFGQRHDAEVVPIAAVFERNGQPAVYLIEGTPPRTVLRTVQVGVTEGNVVEIVSGLSVGEQVVTLGARLVADGQSVQTVPVPWPESTEVIAALPAVPESGE